MISILEQIDQQNRQTIRTLVDGLAGTDSVTDALSGAVSVQAFADALGCTNAANALQAQLSSANAITAALAPPPIVGLDIRRAFGGALIGTRSK